MRRCNFVCVPSDHHPNHPDVVTPVRVDPDGVLGPTPNEARGRRWRRSSPGFYVPAEVSTTLPEQRIVEAANCLPRYGGVTGWAALCWMGGRWFDGLELQDGHLVPRDVPLATMMHARPWPGVQISEERVLPRDIIVVDGLPLTIPVRSVFFESRYATGPESAVRPFDMAAYDDLVSLEECAEYLLYLNGWTGVPQSRKALGRAEENAWSPTEVGMRLRWLDSGLAQRLLCNTPIFTVDGRLVGAPDLFDPDAGIVGEYDGSHHLVGAQRSRDVRREAAFRSVGLEYVTMLNTDLADHGHFLWRLGDTYRRASLLAQAQLGASSPEQGEIQRRWTLDGPGWWLPTDTVAQRRALTYRQQTRLLKHRRDSP